MTISFFKNTQDVSNYKYISTEYTENEIVFSIIKDIPFTCLNCSSTNVTATYVKDRIIKGLPSGTKQTRFKVKTHRIKCHKCGLFKTENISFIDSPLSRVSSCLARFIVEIRKHMTIQSVSTFYGVHWDTVKNIEKKALQQKYKNIQLSQVTKIGIDEVFMGKTIGEKGYLTIVRDLVSGGVLFVGKGKKGECLNEFAEKLRDAGAKIEAVAVDFAPSFTAWIRENIPDAKIVYDHFHVIKLMNDKLSSIRRTTMNNLEEEEKKSLKNRMWHYVTNKENLNKKATEELEICNKIHANLGIAHYLKESLRNIYKISPDSVFAKIAFERWCEMALETGISQMKTMAKTIKRQIDGILSFWDTGLTSAAMEGFNNKIGWLTRQAYGYRDEAYLILKIYDLPKLKIEKILV